MPSLDNRNKLISLSLGIIILGILITNALLPEERRFLKDKFPEFQDGSKELFSFDPARTDEIGFEYLDLNGNVTTNLSQALVVHTWNNKSDYYFNKSSGIQFTNHYEEYWSKNVFCGGYKNASNEWEYKCNDALNFNQSISTDNSTYVNYTLWKDFSIGTKDVRAVIRYHLQTQDNNLTVQMYLKNIGTSDINTDTGFAWRIKDIKIKNTTANDEIYINETRYNLSENLNLSFVNLENSFYRLVEGGSFDPNGEAFISLSWDNSTTNQLIVENQSGQSNAPVTLGINMGTLLVGQEKITNLYWQDPLQVFFEDCTDMTGWVIDGGSTSGWAPGSGADSGLCKASNTDSDANMTSVVIDLSDPTIISANVSLELETINMDTGEYWRAWANSSTTGTFQLMLEETSNGAFPVNLQIDNSIVLDGGVHIRFSCNVNANNEKCLMDNINVSTVNNIPPKWFDNSTNDTFAGNFIKHSVRWTDDFSLEGYIFSFDNGSNQFVNDSFVGMTGTANWSNVSKIVNFTGGTLIQWKVYTNDSNTGWNLTDTFSYLVDSYGNLQVNITSPEDSSEWFQGYTNLTLNATVLCVGDTGAQCGTLTAFGRYNLTANPDTDINKTFGATPLFPITGGTKTKSYNFTGVSYPSSTNNATWLLSTAFSSTIAFDPAGQVEFNETKADGNRNYTNIDTQDDGFEAEINSTVANLFPYMRFKMAITEDVSTIVNITIQARGEGNRGNGVTKRFEVYAWNQSDTEWAFLGSHSNEDNDDVNYTFNSTSTITTTEALETGDLVLLILGGSFVTENGTLDVDFVEAIVTYTSGDNPITSSETIEQGEWFNVSWGLNVSTASTVTHLLDVFINSSLGSLNVPDNDTDDRTVSLNPTGVDVTSPFWFDNSTNSTTAGAFVEHRVRWTDSALESYTFSFDNGSGTFINDTFVGMTGSANWSNVSKTINFTGGTTIQWKVYANDTVGNLNLTDTFSYLTTTDTCSCPSINTNWEIDMEDSCQIYTDCDIGTGNITFINTGNATFNATITSKDMWQPPSSSTLFIGGECVVNLG